jgi:hypothetical protein
MHLTVYAGFGSWCGWAPYHGWVLGYSASTPAREIVFNTSPNSWGAGLWESESGITVDAHGYLYLVTGNGPFDLNRGGPDAGDTVLEAVPEHDQDLGSGSPLVVPGERELVLSSKTGAIYVLSEASPGKYHSVPAPCDEKTEQRTDIDTIKQELSFDTVQGGMWGTWAFWSQAAATSYVYGSGSNDVINCEDNLTQNSEAVIIDPPSTEPVDTTPLFNSSTNSCYDPSSFNGGGGGGTGTAGTIVGNYSSLCLSVTGDSSALKTTADINTCDGSVSENWTVN